MSETLSKEECREKHQEGFVLEAVSGCFTDGVGREWVCVSCRHRHELTVLEKLSFHAGDAV